MKTKLKGAICAAALVVVAAGCNNFLKGGDLTKDPNNPLNATPRQLFTSVQSNMWQLQTSDFSRLTTLWTQQLVGEARQQLGVYNYTGVTEGTFDGQFAFIYGGGGILDLRKIDSSVTVVGDSIFLGISKVLEAWYIGTAADMWGDVPYSQADSFFKYPTPVLDPQQTVYDTIQARLSQAIAEMQSGIGAGPGSVDLVYGGKAALWIRLAHTLKARFYLHTAEAVGSAAYASAFSEAQLGISSNVGDYVANFSGSQAAESNPWWQFADANGPAGRNGDIIATGSFLENLMLQTSDPRFPDFFKPGSLDTYDISPYRLSPAYSQPFVTYNENLLIQAEAQFQAGATGPALTSLNQERAAWNTATAWHRAYVVPPVGAASLGAIMNEKYIVEFQNIEAYNDYLRTCYPQLTGIGGGKIPARLLYPLGEAQTNPNIPAVSAQPPRNWNNPNACSGGG
ncbi:MAG: SusD/RagB family nutrient-binding outer membrane lipoprotein [Gemmatimonadota bacterium]|nr:SusD/RagB family nutrient-binding outer membrane lipoprotein [Gemmatimonadota bacterium]